MMYKLMGVVCRKPSSYNRLWRGEQHMTPGQFAVIIIAFVIVSAVITKKCTVILFLGSFFGAIYLYRGNALAQWCVILQTVIAENAWLWLVCGLFGSLIELFNASGGLRIFSQKIERLCDTQQKTMLASVILGFVLFIDDYLNVLTIGVCMKPAFDKTRTPREALAFILDSTAAPVCALIPFSTWAVFYAGLFYNEPVIASQFSSGTEAYIRAIPFCFYPIFAVLIVLMFSLRIFPRLGAMKRAFLRAESTGMVYSEESRKYNLSDNKDTENASGSMLNFLIPLLALVIISVISGDILSAVIASIIICSALNIFQKNITVTQVSDKIIQGFGSMLSVFFLLVGAFSLEYICDELHVADYILELASPVLSAKTFPMVSFLLLGAIAFATGSNWGMSAITVPILLPIGNALGANPILVMAAIISGGVFGSHACFYTDATVMASNSAGIENMEHALSQFPYVAIAAVVSAVSFFVSAAFIS